MKDSNNIFDFLGFGMGLEEVGNFSKGLTSIKSHILQEIEAKDFGVDFVYFSGDFPSVYFKRMPESHFDQNSIIEIQKTQKKIWNQGKVALLYVDSPTQIRVYNCYATPPQPNDGLGSPDDIQLYQANKSNEHQMEVLLKVFGKIAVETGTFWQDKKYAPALENSKRVNVALINNLKKTREILSNKHQLPTDVIHDILLRSLFILYLEDRGATDKKFYSSFLLGCNSYFELLKSDLKATYLLFEKLEKSFNGNLCPVTDIERAVVTMDHLKLIRDCFWDPIIQDRLQLKLIEWKAFDFKYIPIELLSEIYEEFLLHQDSKRKKDEGAYYTPHTLVEFILNKELPWADKTHKDYNMKILDPTCGSGIFLVESLKRLIGRWEFSHPNKKIEFKDLIGILTNNIFGIEINPEAIKVAAFSLYLAILDKLEPKTLWKDKRFPFLIYDPTNTSTKKQGKNLFCMSSLTKGPFIDISYNLLVGNPPFKEGNLDDDTKKYVRENNLPQEKVIAFLHRAMRLSPTGRIALVVASKPLLFNGGKKYVNFRRALFNDHYVEQIYNFSILRKTSKRRGGNLFSSAVGPASVIFLQSSFPKDPKSTITYCAPKSIIKNNFIDGVAIDNVDINFLPRGDCQDGSSLIWKVAMWGTRRDYILIQRLGQLNNLKSIFSQKNNDNWVYGVGFQTSQPLNKIDNKISALPFMPARKMQRYYVPQDRTEPITTNKFRRLGAVNAYKGPHVLIKEGQTKKEFSASYIDYDCSFKDTILGIAGSDTSKLKSLTAFLNSKFTSYYLFLTASSWGIERERVKPKEVLQLPYYASVYTALTNTNLGRSIDEIKNIRSNFVLNESEQIQKIENEIDATLSGSLGLDDTDKYLIENVVENGIGMFNQGLASKAYKRSTDGELKKYLSILCREITRDFDESQEIGAWATLYVLPHAIPLRMISIHLNKQRSDASVVMEKSSSTLDKILRDLEQFTYEKFSESIYYRKHIRFYSNDTIFILKPDEKRFWSPSLALNDADELILEIINS